MSVILAGWPFERTSAEQVDVQMGNGFSAIGTVVDNDSIAGLGDAFFARDFGGGQEQVPEQCFVSGVRQGDAGDPLARHHKDVQGGLW